MKKLDSLTEQPKQSPLFCIAITRKQQEYTEYSFQILT